MSHASAPLGAAISREGFVHGLFIATVFLESI